MLQLLEKFVLYFVQNIESHEYISIVRQLVGIQMLDDFAIQHAFVSNVLFGQVLFETVVDVSKHIPHGNKPFFEGGSTFDGKVLKELLDSFFLFLVHESIVVHQRSQLL